MVEHRRRRVRVGISGWVYPRWRGSFYPPGLRQRDELAYASQRLDAIEINGTFYSLQSADSFRRWRDATPEGFVFAVKGHRQATHFRRLVGATASIADFFSSGVLALGDKLGPVLWQTPPNLRFDARILDAFLGALPHSTAEAAALIGRHGRLESSRRWLPENENHRIRHALEVRHESFLDPSFAEILRRHRVAAVVADTAGRYPRIREVTADHVYVRLHGDSELYASGYGEKALREWADAARGWADGSACPDHVGRDVYVFFDNDVKVRAPYDAMRLREMLTESTTTL